MSASNIQGSFKDTVHEIQNMPWKDLSTKELQQVMYLSWVSAMEFAEGVRLAIGLYPDNPKLITMAAGEIDANNLHFGDYARRGDHSKFLSYFLEEHNITPTPKSHQAAKKYLALCRSLPVDVRAMSVFSREQELPNIFSEILKAPDWSEPGLAAYRYYLGQHIQLDTSSGGHGEMTQDFPITEQVAPFYKARRDLYREAIAKLG